MSPKWPAAAAVAVLVVVSLQVPADARINSGLATQICQERDTTVSHPYPISGFWIFQRRDPCDIRSTVEATHRQGGDTLLTFGPRLTPRSISADGQVLTASGTPDPVFTGCVVNGQTCHRDAVSTLTSAHPDNRIVTTYAYSSLERYGPALLRCGLDRELLQTAERIYYRLLVPDADPRSCAGPGTRAYRLVLVAGAPTDWLSTLLTEADAYGVSVYHGLPMPPTHPAPHTWRPDLAHLDMLHELTRRILSDYAGRHGSHASMSGLYQSFETPLKQTTNADIVTLYNDQHRLVREILPGRKIVVSPYWDARRGNSNGTPPEDVAAGFKNVARTDVDVIAPQDSRGTGKVGLFWPYELGQPVDERLAVTFTGITPGTSYGDAYFGSTTDLFKSVSDARRQLAAEGVSVELWANLEAFEPTEDGDLSCGWPRTLTDKARLDRALMFARNYGSKVISFMWDGHYDCVPTGGGIPLRDQIAADFDRPVLAQAFKWRSSPGPGEPERDGLVIRGYHLTSSTVQLAWYDSGWNLRSQEITVETAGWFDPYTGADSPELPDMMQSVWVPFSWTDMAPSFWLHITVTNISGTKTTHRFSLTY